MSKTKRQVQRTTKTKKRMFFAEVGLPNDEDPLGDLRWRSIGPFTTREAAEQAVIGAIGSGRFISGHVCPWDPDKLRWVW